MYVFRPISPFLHCCLSGVTDEDESQTPSIASATKPSASTVFSKFDSAANTPAPHASTSQVKAKENTVSQTSAHGHGSKGGNSLASPRKR